MKESFRMLEGSHGGWCLFSSNAAGFSNFRCNLGVSFMKARVRLFKYVVLELRVHDFLLQARRKGLEIGRFGVSCSQDAYFE
jgi:hypothetical protein